jgi:Arc/MetJ-type ribon-helix-helix transcriptional regulator
MSKRVVWSIPVPEALDIAVESAVRSGTFISKSELVREACRKALIALSTPS